MSTPRTRKLYGWCCLLFRFNQGVGLFDGGMHLLSGFFGPFGATNQICISAMKAHADEGIGGIDGQSHCFEDVAPIAHVAFIDELISKHRTQ